MKDDFPATVSYNRFTELIGQNLMAMSLFLKTCCLGGPTGISFVDSTPIRVCKPKRIKNNKVFKGIATTGKYTMAWFHGFKLNIIINDKGETINFTITQGNVDDRAPLKKKFFLDKIYGKLYPDKRYIGKDLMQFLFADGLHLITHIKNNMKNSLIKILMYDVSVKKVLEQDSNLQESIIDIHNLMSGVYNIKIISDKETIVKKIIKKSCQL